MREFEKKIIEWKAQVERFNRCESDHDRCPVCNDQLFFCHCHHDLAHEALEELYFGDGEEGSKAVILSVEALNKMTKRLAKLERLEAYGVDNWSGYSDAVTDSEGIFGEEEEEEEE